MRGVSPWAPAHLEPVAHYRTNVEKHVATIKLVLCAKQQNGYAGLVTRADSIPQAANTSLHTVYRSFGAQHDYAAF